MTEIQKYSVLETGDGFEIRQYEPFITVSTLENAGIRSAGNRAFQKLAGFIFGGNSESKRIAMTAPVTEKPMADGYEVSFVMPAGMTMEEMPKPSGGNLTIAEHPGQKMAAITFSGLVGEKAFANQEQKLKNLLTGAGLTFDPTPIYARYDAPTTPFFLRRNEVLLALDSSPAKRGTA